MQIETHRSTSLLAAILTDTLMPPIIRVDAAYALADAEDTTVNQRLINALRTTPIPTDKDDPNGFILAQTYVALTRRPDIDIYTLIDQAAPLLESLQASNDIRSVINALGSTAHPEVIPLLSTMLNHQDTEVQYAAITALGHIKDPQTASLLITKLEEPEKPGRLDEAKTAIANTLAVIGEPESIYPLFNALVPCTDNSAIHRNEAIINAIASISMTNSYARGIELLRRLSRSESVRFKRIANAALESLLDTTLQQF